MEIIDRIKNKFFMNHIRITDGAVYQYDFLMSLPEKKYEKYLKEAYFLRKNKKLDMKRPKTLNEKIQWLKIYDNLPIKTQLTDKVLAREWVAQKIGTEYLKPVFQICDDFYSIDFDKLPSKFVLKCNHGCKWQFVILNKEAFLKRADFFRLAESNINGWLASSFFGWSDFETQYKNITPKLIIEKYLRDGKDDDIREFCIYCFNSEPKVYEEIKNVVPIKTYCFYNKDFQLIPLKLNNGAVYKEDEAIDNLKKAVELSKILAEGFKFVRIDWYMYKDKLYFNEMTFTPFSGDIPFEDEKFDVELGNMLNLKEN